MMRERCFIFTIVVVTLLLTTGAGSVAAQSNPSNFQITDITTNSPITEGEDLRLSYTVENTGGPGTQTIVGSTPDLPDSDPRSSRSGSLPLNAGESVTVPATVPTSEGDAGEYEVIIETENDTASTTVTVEEAELEPPNFQITGITTNSPITEGEDVRLSYTVGNSGGPGTQTVVGSTPDLPDSDPRSSRSGELTLGAGDSVTVPATVPTSEGDAGEYEVIIETENDTASTTVTVEESEPDPPNFQIKDLTTNSPIVEGENLTLSYTVENTGGPGTQTVVGSTPDLPDSDPRSSQSGELTLGAGESITVPTTVPTSEGDAGEYEVIIETENDTTATLINVSESVADSPNFEISSLTTNSPITEGENLTLSYTVSNTGGPGTQTIESMSPDLPDEDPRSNASDTLTLQAGESVPISATVPTSEGDAGEYEAIIETENDTASTTVTVEESDVEFPNFQITGITTNSPITEGEELTLSYTVINTGGPGTQRVVGSTPDLPDSDPRSSQSGELTLGAGESVTVPNKVQTSEGDAGEYEVIIETENDTVTGTVTVGDKPTEQVGAVRGAGDDSNELERQSIQDAVFEFVTGDETFNGARLTREGLQDAVFKFVTGG
jgi:hypothetical protein